VNIINEHNCQGLFGDSQKVNKRLHNQVMRKIANLTPQTCFFPLIKFQPLRNSKCAVHDVCLRAEDKVANDRSPIYWTTSQQQNIADPLPNNKCRVKLYNLTAISINISSNCTCSASRDEHATLEFTLRILQFAIIFVIPENVFFMAQ